MSVNLDGGAPRLLAPEDFSLVPNIADLYLDEIYVDGVNDPVRLASQIVDRPGVVATVGGEVVAAASYLHDVPTHRVDGRVTLVSDIAVRTGLQRRSGLHLGTQVMGLIARDALNNNADALTLGFGHLRGKYTHRFLDALGFNDGAPGQPRFLTGDGLEELAKSADHADIVA